MSEFYLTIILFRFKHLCYRNIDRVRKHSPKFEGNHRSVEDVKYFLYFYFISARRLVSVTLIQHLLKSKLFSRFSERVLYHHFTVAIDTSNIRLVFKDVKDTILHKNLDSLLLN